MKKYDADYKHFHPKITEYLNEILLQIITKILNNGDSYCKAGVKQNITAVQARNQDIVRGRLEPKVKFFCSKDVSNGLPWESVCKASGLWAIIVTFRKKYHFNAIWNTFRTVS